MGITDRLKQTISGKYLIEDFIGSGGMGLVYAASHQLTHERVAVKFLRSEFVDHPEVTQRFLKEAQAIVQLKHRNAVRLIDLDVDPQYGMYMVLELLHGESLETHLTGVDRLPFSLACEWLLPIMDAVQLAHTRNVLHRDIKPANIFLHREADGSITPKLLDFGLVRVMNAQSALRTKTGQVLGTPTHMSPEQAEGKRELGPATDVWSMAVVWQRCLSGIEPFERSTLDATLLAVALGDYKPLTVTCPELPGVAVLADSLGRALCVDPRARTQNMLELSAQLRDAERKLHAQALDVTSPRPVVREQASRGRLLRRAALGVGAAVALSAAYWGMHVLQPTAAKSLPQRSAEAATAGSHPSPSTAHTLSPTESQPHAVDAPPARSSAPLPGAGEALTPKPAPVPNTRGKAAKATSDLDLGEILVR